jgi:dTDP-4-dehydrorhamnose reductase
MRIVVLGACGMLGRDVVDSLLSWGTLDVTALCHDDCDVTSRMDVLEAVEGPHGRADVVINCAAYTDVDGAEADPGTAHMVNGYGPWNIVSVLQGTDVKFIHISSDYVFDGLRPLSSSYIETTLTHAPPNAYGRSKLDGEKAVWQYEHGFVIRSAWLYGDGKCFPRTMLQLASQHEVLKVVNDQHGTPTWTRELARRIVEVAIRAHDDRIGRGIYHVTSPDSGTWYDLARETFWMAGLDPERIKAVSSSEFPRPAIRPTNSVLSSVWVSEAGLTRLPDWRLQLQRAFKAGIFSEVMREN